MTKQDHINYWLTTAEHDLEVAESLFSSAKYDYCLFISHLVIEKVLKAFWVRDNEGNIPPKIHNLPKLISQTKLSLTYEQSDFLRVINNFNMETRYPDEKLKFYKQCNQEFATVYFDQIKDLYKWLLTQV